MAAYSGDGSFADEPFVKAGADLQQLAELAADEVAGGDLAQAQSQAGDLAGEELHVCMRLCVGAAVALVLDPVTRLLAVLRQEDERSGVRGLQAEHQRQEDERIVVPAEVVEGVMHRCIPSIQFLGSRAQR